MKDNNPNDNIKCVNMPNKLVAIILEFGKKFARADIIKLNELFPTPWANIHYSALNETNETLYTFYVVINKGSAFKSKW